MRLEDVAYASFSDMYRLLSCSIKQITSSILSDVFLLKNNPFPALSKVLIAVRTLVLPPPVLLPGMGLSRAFSSQVLLFAMVTEGMISRRGRPYSDVFVMFVTLGVSSMVKTCAI